MQEMKLAVWTVSELNAALKDLLENTFLPVCILGEVGGITIHRSGHVYFTLKDESAQIRAVFFAGAQACRENGIENGTRVEARGRISFYAQRGECQLAVTDLKPVGEGILQQRFEEMKKRLAAEGLFDPERKRRLPFVPRCIGIVTSPDGAAIKDFIKVALQRFPPLRFRVYPAPVQGKGAELKLADGVRFFNRYRAADVILLTRGGGSLEDLWPFNEEILARAVAESRLPVVSAVGHEIDTTICDLVADMRAPTPTAAAEVLLPDFHALCEDRSMLLRRLRNAAELSCERASGALNRLLSAKALVRPTQMLLERTQSIDLLVNDMEHSLENAFRTSSVRMDHLESQLSALNPSLILKRGYSVLLNDSGKAVVRPEQAPAGTKLTARLSEGSITLVSQNDIQENPR